ncbi:MAG: phosphoglycolate phosphatase [Pseudomonadota bacterium]|nr:phosphoglycolate phosphatase [Pseudomonadota bacterium]MEC8295796.1 phosphoglycolate phosphatase [Pseudomonadota bacterium]
MARIVFDLDGTLINSAPEIQFVANSLLADRGLEPLSLQETIGFIGNGAAVLIEKMSLARGIDPSEHATLLATLEERYMHSSDKSEVYPNVVAALDSLRGAGHRLGVCTNKPLAPAKAVLAHLDLAKHFDVVLGGDSLPQRKPDPAPLHATFDALGDGPVIYVGDSDVDAETAHRAGVPFLLFTEGYCKVPHAELPHHALFDDFARLPELVQALVSA